MQNIVSCIFLSGLKYDLCKFLDWKRSVMILKINVAATEQGQWKWSGDPEDSEQS